MSEHEVRRGIIVHMPIERRIDPQTAEGAEFARKNGRVEIAAEFSAIALSNLTSEAIAQLVEDPQQRSLLACLARIHVDSLKTVAANANSPRIALTSLEQAAQTLQQVHKNPVVIASLVGVTEDHKGRGHNFDAEMKRDQAKTIFVAKSLYRGDEANALSNRGEQVLQKVYDALPKDHPTRPLIGIELQLHRGSRGEPVDNEKLLVDFAMIREDSEENNPERVATVASWFIVSGEQQMNSSLQEAGINAYNEVVKNHPGLRWVSAHTRQKRGREKWQQRAFPVLASMTTSARRRDKLHSMLLK